MPAPQQPPIKDGQLFTDHKDGTSWIGKGGKWVQQPKVNAAQGQGVGATLANAGGQIAGNVMGSILANKGQALRNGPPVISNGNNNMAVGTGQTNAAAGLNEQAAEHDQQSARLKADAQRGYQIGNRDERVEAQKDAASKEAHVYDKTINQMDAATGSGTAAFLAQNTQEGNMSEHRQRADTQRAHGEDLTLKAEDATQVAIQERTAAREADRQEEEVGEENQKRGEIQPPPEADPPGPPDEDPPAPPDEDPPGPPKPDKPEPPPSEAAEEGKIRIRNALSEIWDKKGGPAGLSAEQRAKYEEIAKKGELTWIDDAEGNNGGGTPEKWDKWAEEAENFLMEVMQTKDRNAVSIRRSAQGGRINSETGSGGSGTSYAWLDDGKGNKRYAQLRKGLTADAALQSIKDGHADGNIYVLGADGDYKNWPSDKRVKRIKGKVSDRRLKTILPMIHRRFI